MQSNFSHPIFHHQGALKFDDKIPGLSFASLCGSAALREISWQIHAKPQKRKGTQRRPRTEARRHGE